jgi:hypothetical protein
MGGVEFSIQSVREIHKTVKVIPNIVSAVLDYE